MARVTAFSSLARAARTSAAAVLAATRSSECASSPAVADNGAFTRTELAAVVTKMGSSANVAAGGEAGDLGMYASKELGATDGGILLMLERSAALAALLHKRKKFVLKKKRAARKVPKLPNASNKTSRTSLRNTARNTHAVICTTSINCTARALQIGGPAEARRRLLRSIANASAPPAMARNPSAPPTTAPIGTCAAAAAGATGDALLGTTGATGAPVASGVGSGVEARAREGDALGRRVCGALDGAADGLSDGDDDGELSTGADEG